MRRILICVGGLIGLFVAVIVIRTALASRAPIVPVIQTANPAFNADRSAEHLAEAIRFRTISRDTEPAPFAEVNRFHEWLDATYPQIAKTARRETLPNGTLLYQWSGSDPNLPPLVLMVHQDVVPADDARQWVVPPFDGIVRGDAIWGRGAIDDKGSLVAIMEAVESLASAQIRPTRGVILLFGHDEEIGGTGAQSAAAVLKQRGIQPWMVLDEGSLAIADHPATNKPAALVGISEKGYLTLRLTAVGKGGHSSAPPDDTAVALLEGNDCGSEQPVPAALSRSDAHDVRRVGL